MYHLQKVHSASFTLDADSGATRKTPQRTVVWVSQRTLDPGLNAEACARYGVIGILFLAMNGINPAPQISKLVEHFFNLFTALCVHGFPLNAKHCGRAEQGQSFDTQTPALMALRRGHFGLPTHSSGAAHCLLARGHACWRVQPSRPGQSPLALQFP